MKAVREHRITMDAKGRVVLPHAVRETAGLSAGAGLVASIEADGAIRIEKLSSRISQVQDRLAKYAVPGRLTSDELIVERRREAERE